MDIVREKLKKRQSLDDKPIAGKSDKKVNESGYAVGHLSKTQSRNLLTVNIVDDDIPVSIHQYTNEGDVIVGRMSTRPSMELLRSNDETGQSKDKRPSLKMYSEHEQFGSNYRKRASLDILHDRYSVDLDPGNLPNNGTLPNDSSIMKMEETQHKEPEKFGWIRGVLIRCILSILGTMIFLRLSWVSGQAGILLGTLIALLSTLITVITALSMCALCTNGQISTGGAYFMLSRSLGPEFGGSMGVIFGLADAVAAAMNVVGFAESLRDLLYSNGFAIIDPDDDVRIIGAITMLALFILVMISVSWEAKIELVLLVIVVISYTSFIVGTIMGPDNPTSLYDESARGVTGYNWNTFTTNLVPAFKGETFISVFAIYFPSTTGIMAGAGISGELKEPDKALPKGTLLGIAITSAVYISGIWLTGATCVREASGNLSDTLCVEFNNCSYGLRNDYNVMELESAFWPLIIAGTFATSLSSALTLIVTSPRTIQALAKDSVFPFIGFLAKPSGKDGEPRRAYCLVFVICLGIIAIGNLNAIAPLISNFYLASFALINYACFDGSLAKSPNWRPSFKYYNMWVALIGAALCVVSMFIMQWIMALVTIAIMFFLYVFVLRSKPNVNWGSSGQAHLYKNALQNMLSLAYTEEHVKNYRASIMLLSGNPVIRPCLVNFVSNITKNTSLLICGDVIVSSTLDDISSQLKKGTKKIQCWMKKRKIKTFYCPVVVANKDDGFKALLQLAGLGKLRPNIVVLGFKRNWKQCPIAEIEDYFYLIHEIFGQNMGIAFLCQKEGFDYTEQITGGKTVDQFTELLYRNPNHTTSSSISNPATPGGRSNPATPTGRSNHSQPIFVLDPGRFTPPDTPASQALSVNANNDTEFQFPTNAMSVKRRAHFDIAPSTSGSISRTESWDSINSTADESSVPPTPSGVYGFYENRKKLNLEDERQVRQRKKSQLQRELDRALNQYRIKLEIPKIDVWWLFDDGGLTLLLSYLLSLKKSYLAGAKLRLFTYVDDINNIAEEKRSLESLLEKFRIKCEVYVLGDIYEKPEPKDGTIAEFNRIVNRFKRVPTEYGNYKSQVYVTDGQLEILKDKTNLYLRTRELLMEYSREVDLIVVTIPIPKKGRDTACLYLAWLEMLSRDLSPYDVPVLLIRGNQENVLTFYS